MVQRALTPSDNTRNECSMSIFGVVLLLTAIIVTTTVLFWAVRSPTFTVFLSGAFS